MDAQGHVNWTVNYQPIIKSSEIDLAFFCSRLVNSSVTEARARNFFPTPSGSQRGAHKFDCLEEEELKLYFTNWICLWCLYFILQQFERSKKIRGKSSIKITLHLCISVLFCMLSNFICCLLYCFILSFLSNNFSSDFFRVFAFVSFTNVMFIGSLFRPWS